MGVHVPALKGHSNPVVHEDSAVIVRMRCEFQRTPSRTGKVEKVEKAEKAEKAEKVEKVEKVSLVLAHIDGRFRFCHWSLLVLMVDFGFLTGPMGIF